MSEMVRLATVRRGLDPRDFILVPSGGAGPLHATAIAREVGISEVVVPPLPGMFSAVGAMLSPIRHDVSVSMLRPVADLTRDTLQQAFEPLREKLEGLLAAEQDRIERPRLQRYADIRFRGQLFQLRIPVGEGGAELPDGRSLEAQFRAAYVAEYGFDLPNGVPEVVTLRAAAAADTGDMSAQVFASGARTGQAAASAGLRTTLVDAAGKKIDVPVHFADAVPVDVELTGPAIIAIAGAAVWLQAGDTARVDARGSIHIKTSVRS